MNPIMGITKRIFTYQENTPVICEIGLGYVGLPLAVAFGVNYQTIGFDIKSDLIDNFKIL